MIEKIANRICMLLNRSEYERFMKISGAGDIQNNLLMRIINRNIDSEFGRRYRFNNIRSYSDFTANVPITEYADYKTYIDKIANGMPKILTTEPVRLFELTSGSGGAKKLIPYTKSLKQEFCCGIKPWLYDIYKNCSGVKNGKSYWSITPVVSKKEYTNSGIPIGFEEDTEYFGGLESYFAGRIFAVDTSVKFCGDMDEFYYKTCRQLLKCKNLTLISVWNPTFLLVLTDFMRDHAEKLLDGIHRKNAADICKHLHDGRFEKVFPKLKIISCWCDGNAENYRKEIEERFHDVYIQPKGLLATECFVSFPLIGEDGSRLSLYSHFFEFRNLSDNKIGLADSLEQGGKYEVIVTTGGGFYRYRMKDTIEVVSVKNGIPLIKFAGRADRMSDLFGEKLDEQFAQAVLKKLKINGFAMLAPEKDRYVLYTQSDQFTDRNALDQALREGFHYNYCRELGQLKEPKIFRIKGNPEKEYLERYSDTGMRLGDIKTHALSLESDWYKYFNGEFL